MELRLPEFNSGPRPRGRRAPAPRLRRRALARESVATDDGNDDAGGGAGARGWWGPADPFPSQPGPRAAQPDGTQTPRVHLGPAPSWSPGPQPQGRVAERSRASRWLPMTETTTREVGRGRGWWGPADPFPSQPGPRAAQPDGTQTPRVHLGPAPSWSPGPQPQGRVAERSRASRWLPMTETTTREVGRGRGWWGPADPFPSQPGPRAAQPDGTQTPRVHLGPAPSWSPGPQPPCPNGRVAERSHARRWLAGAANADTGGGAGAGGGGGPPTRFPANSDRAKPSRMELSRRRSPRPPPSWSPGPHHPRPPPHRRRQALTNR